MWLKDEKGEWGEYFYRIKGTDIDPVKLGMQLSGTYKESGKIYCTHNGEKKEVVLVKIKTNDTR